jgi:hypothetical protein
VLSPDRWTSCGGRVVANPGHRPASGPIAADNSHMPLDPISPWIAGRVHLIQLSPTVHAVRPRPRYTTTTTPPP